MKTILSLDAVKSQKGAVAITVALSLVVLLGFLGLVVDLGRMYVAKTELQNAADACSLAAASQLNSGTVALTRAVSFGIAVGTHNKVGFQATPVSIQASDITFSPVLSQGGSNAVYQSQAAGADPATAKYARCVLALPNIPMYFMQVMGFGPQTVSAGAVASLGPSQTACGFPVGLCEPPGGFNASHIGQWISGKFEAGGGGTGSFNWIDFDPPAGGASELADLLAGKKCNIPSNPPPIGQTGIIQSAAVNWNSRFGLYKGGGGNPSPVDATPDLSGYSYTTTNWPAGSNAWPDFRDNRRPGNLPYQGNAATGLSIGMPPYTALTPAQHLQYGDSSRRLVSVPVVDCNLWATQQTVPLKSWACVFLLQPVDAPGDTIKMEYLGQGSTATACGNAGLPGSATSMGPPVPRLVQ